MIYYLSQLSEVISWLNIFRYITFRAFLGFLISFFLSIFLFPKFIEYLKKKQFVQTIREDGPKTHLVKQNTPTMGGLIILLSLIISVIITARPNRFVIWSIICVVYLGILGFLDDYLKIIKKHPKAVAPKQKLFFQILFSLVLCIYLYIYPQNYIYSTHLHIPYLKETFINLGIFYFLIVILTFVGASNGINLTDGLDGLAIGNVIFASIAYSILSYVAGNYKLASYLKLIYIPGSGELSIVLACLIGAGLGFLWFNSYPATIFMGDSGSLFLGGLLGLIAIFIKQELLLLVAGGVFVVESLSVLLQVGYYRRTKKRIFLMAPLHHHYELKGYHEAKITVRFWIVGIILAILTLASLKIR
ncbi:MAG: phospho-N-acetylmuramoyl-pentapeptide-transferase [Elusimicrobiota bacterium]|nr:phospho-N-acetylmuramoyl-pentapeptide-transferase [Endomicrobiia bacterium]MCX7910428.1 phospho-N-acetylmuramoyl-pentapeptide-transferase [Endomicrobiia bacterium]MDW8165879.1 phospho-N-acetylmuramoyl-pentapeptide-transferase [Elusimicrobiota bacterium]